MNKDNKEFIEKLYNGLDDSNKEKILQLAKMYVLREEAEKQTKNYGKEIFIYKEGERE